MFFESPWTEGQSLGQFQRAGETLRRTKQKRESRWGPTNRFLFWGDNKIKQDFFFFVRHVLVRGASCLSMTATDVITHLRVTSCYHALDSGRKKKKASWAMESSMTQINGFNNADNKAGHHHAVRVTGAIAGCRHWMQAGIKQDHEISLTGSCLFACVLSSPVLSLLLVQPFELDCRL